MASSKLQEQIGVFLRRDFPDRTIRETVRPDWLLNEEGNRLELDFYIEELALAFEIQGEQHFVYNDFFHGSPESFKKRLRDDKTKRDICRKYNVELCEICSVEDYEDFIRATFSEYSTLRALKQPFRSPNGILKKSLFSIHRFRYSLHRTEERIARCDPNDQERLLRLNRKLVKINRYIAAQRVRIGVVLSKYPEIARKLAKASARAIARRDPADHNKQDKKTKQPPPKPPKLIGSQRMRNNARKRQVRQIDRYTWIVFGGSAEHQVTLSDNMFECDCTRAMIRGLCCHTIRVMIERGIPLDDPTAE
jgi:hypothetical protein